MGKANVEHRIAGIFVPRPPTIKGIVVSSLCSRGALSVCPISDARSTASNSPEASFHSHSVERGRSTPWRLKIRSWRLSGNDGPS